MKFGDGDLYKKLSGRHESRDNLLRGSDSHTFYFGA